MEEIFASLSLDDTASEYLQAVKVLDLKFILVDSIPLLEAMLSTFSNIGTFCYIKNHHRDLNNTLKTRIQRLIVNKIHRFHRFRE